MARSTRDLIVRTPDLARAVHFYRDVLGFAVAEATPGLVGFETGAFRLYVEAGPAHGPVMELLVPDVAAARDRLVAGGCRVLEEDAAVPRCYLLDPQGLAFNLGPDRGRGGGR